MSRVRVGVLLGIAIAVVVLLAWPTQPFGSASWMVTVGANDAGLVPVTSRGPRLGIAALRGDPLSTGDRLRLGIAGLLAFAWLAAVVRSTRSSS